MNPRRILISGPRGAGKTTLLLKALDALRSRKLDIAGILSLPVEVNGTRTAIDAQDLRTWQVRRLASRNLGESGELATRQWSFEPSAVRWADGVLAQACPCDLLIIDELGILEFERGLGWQAGLQALDGGEYRLALAVIRPELLAMALARWPGAEVVEIDPENRQAALDGLLLHLKSIPHKSTAG